MTSIPIKSFYRFVAPRCQQQKRGDSASRDVLDGSRAVAVLSSLPQHQILTMKVSKTRASLPPSLPPSLHPPLSHAHHTLCWGGCCCRF
jgi:hypothetical protein